MKNQFIVRLAIFVPFQVIIFYWTIFGGFCCGTTCSENILKPAATILSGEID